ncbi:MAG TPA: peptide chain release factor N(5)-glutamine methyltransferase [Mogibacterium sp.]|nr:peptide chain release factor N(5)-glutamine methyltransferase [Mogibacterium sp.]
MAKIDYDKIFIKEACPTTIGGQAIMEGVMMQGPERIAIAMRLPSDELYLSIKKKPEEPKSMKIPVIRGGVAFFRSLVLGMSTLMESGSILEKYAPEEYTEEPGKIEKWIDKKFGPKATWNIMMLLTVIFAVVITIAAFIIFPTWIVNYLKHWITNNIALNLIEGVLRIIMFVLYVLGISRMQDIHKLFQYHGAEHKTIHCFENGIELTPENADQFTTLHPRCGTSFLMFVMIISLLLFSLLGWPDLLLRIASRILLIPVIAGLSYELLKWAGRADNMMVRILSWPGLVMQKMTTADPTREQLEVAILALKAVLPDTKIPLMYGFVDKDGNRVKDFIDEEAIGKDDRDIDRKTEEESIESIEEDGKTSEVIPKPKPKRFTYETRTVENALRWGEAVLSMIENGKNDAMLIMNYASGLSRSQLITRAKEVMRDDDFEEYQKRIEARLTGTPLQYIVGIQEFMGRPFRVNPSVLIPRLDTEVLVEHVIKIIESKNLERPRILDMCTGSGAIGVTLAGKFPDAIVTLTDESGEALKTAVGNAGLNRVNRQCCFLIGDMFEALHEESEFDVIVCNPPYIETDVIDTLAIEVRNHEPRKALDGGEDGLKYYRIIAENVADYLTIGGLLALEIGADQGDSVKELLDKTERFGKVLILQDLAGLDRVVITERVK